MSSPGTALHVGNDTRNNIIGSLCHEQILLLIRQQTFFGKEQSFPVVKTYKTCFRCDIKPEFLTTLFQSFFYLTYVDFHGSLGDMHSLKAML